MSIQAHALGKAIIDSIESRGYVIIPREMNDAMMSAAIKKGQEIGYTDVVGIWRAIVAAALKE